VQAGKLLPITIAPPSPSFPTLDQPITGKVFIADAAIFSLDADPSVLPDCLVQVALNKVFIPLSMHNKFLEQD